MKTPHFIYGEPPSTRLFTSIMLLWLAGIGLRITILAVPPVIPFIRADLLMSETQVGILAGLPQVLFACAAVPGSLLIVRFGALATVVFGLLTTAMGSALRGVAPSIALLFAATMVTGFGVAIMQPALPPLVRAWLPRHIGFGSAVFTNGLLIGEILPVALTLPLVLPLVGGSWRLGFAAWAVPVALIALVVLMCAPRPANAISNNKAIRWWPDWKSPLIWRLGLMLGTINAMYFGTNAFIPDFLHATNRADLISPALTALNVSQLPASFILLPIADRLLRRAWPYAGAGALCLIGIMGIMLGDSTILLAATALLGFATAAALVLIFALPPLLSAPDDVHRTSAAMFTISYTCAVIIPIISGIVWDVSGAPFAAFVPVALSSVLLIACAPTVVRSRERAARPDAVIRS